MSDDLHKAADAALPPGELKPTLLDALCGFPVPPKEEYLFGAMASDTIAKIREQFISNVKNGFAIKRKALPPPKDKTTERLAETALEIMREWKAQEEEILAYAWSKAFEEEVVYYVKQLWNKRDNANRNAPLPTTASAATSFAVFLQNTPEEVIADRCYLELLESHTAAMEAKLDNDKKGKPVISLAAEDKTILEAIADENGMTVTIEGLATVTRISEKTVGTRLKYLEGKKLVDRPLGKRKGRGITALGRTQIGRG